MLIGRKFQIVFKAVGPPGPDKVLPGWARQLDKRGLGGAAPPCGFAAFWQARCINQARKFRPRAYVLPANAGTWSKGAGVLQYHPWQGSRCSAQSSPLHFQDKYRLTVRAGAALQTAP